MPYDKITTNFSPSQSYQTLMVPTTTQNQTAQNNALYILGANLKQAKRISTNDAYSISSCSLNIDYISQTTGIYNNNKNSGVIAIFLGSSTGDFVEAMTVQFYTTDSNGNPDTKGSLINVTYINEYQCSLSFPGTIDNYDKGSIKPGYFIVMKHIYNSNGLQICSAKINITYGNINNKNVPQFWGYFPNPYGNNQSIAATSVSIPNYASYVNPKTTDGGGMAPGYINFYNTQDEFAITFRIYMNKNNYALLNGNLTGVLFRWSNNNHEYKYHFYESGFVQPPDKDSDGHTFITANCLFNSNKINGSSTSFSNGVGALSGQDFIIMPFSTVGSCPENAVFFTIYN